LPALPNVPNVIRNVLKFTFSEDTQAAIRFFLKYTGSAPTNAELATFAAGIGTAYAAQLIGLAGEGIILTNVESTDLTSDVSGEGGSAEDTEGTRGPSNLTADTAALESLEIPRRYRGGHPRIYWPFGISSDLENAQTWSLTFVDAMAAALTTFYTDVMALTWSGGSITNRVNVSFYEGFTVHTGPTGRARNVSTPRSSSVVDNVSSSLVRVGVASQRRRLLCLA